MKEINSYKKSIREFCFTNIQESIIWDFYVTKSLSKSSSQNRILEDYHKPNFSRPANFLDKLIKIADVKEDNLKFVYGDSMERCLKELNLFDFDINVLSDFTPRIAIMISAKNQGYYNNFSNKKCLISLMSHIRNALAHGNTYLFDNNYILLEDINHRDNIITARMILSKETLIEWVKVFDNESNFYPEIKIR
ncbi:MAG: hypothetical protein EOM05_08255 [Clostridia bacterium]|nr:hypothetical protein [Clostridia bacterium]